jgi:hypothetical protein
LHQPSDIGGLLFIARTKVASASESVGLKDAHGELAEAELDVLQVAASSLRRLDPAGDPLKAPERVVEDDLDRVHALGGALRASAAATDKLGQLRAQPGLQAVQESYGEDAAFAWRETQPRVRPDGELDATADHLAIAAGMRPAGAPPDQRVIKWRDTRSWSWSEDGCSTVLAVLFAHDATTLT